ncbi:hypothetical protein T09_8890 [Trichinella sp. T9]|nr:hypothetical protein T09_8890 [Trichinella sp. T9]
MKKKKKKMMMMNTEQAKLTKQAVCSRQMCNEAGDGKDKKEEEEEEDKLDMQNEASIPICRADWKKTMNAADELEQCAELTELNGGHAFQWLQTVHNYARYETHYNYNAGHFFLAPRVGQWTKVSSKKMKKKFLITVHASTLQKQLNPYSQGLLIASEPKKIITTRRKILIDLDQGLVPKVAGSREQNVPRQLADHFDQQDAKPSVCVHAWSKAA